MSPKKIKILILIFLLLAIYPASRWGWGEASQAYFNYRCETDAGEFIYRTVENVEGLFQMRPRDPREYFSLLRNGDLPEDPYGHTNLEAQNPWKLFLRHPSEPTYQFFETTKAPNLQEYDLQQSTRIFSIRPELEGKSYWRFTYDGLRRRVNGKTFWTMLYPEQTSELKSQYGFTWRETQTDWDRFFGVIGGELIIKEMAAGETLAIRRGFFFWPRWVKRGGICPKQKDDNVSFTFIKKVLKPAPFDASVLKEKDYGY